MAIKFIRDNLIVEKVHHRRKIKGLWAILNIGDVGDPFLVWLACMKLSLQQIWGNNHRLALRFPFSLRFDPTLKVMFLHELLYSVPVQLDLIVTLQQFFDLPVAISIFCLFAKFDDRLFYL